MRHAVYVAWIVLVHALAAVGSVSLYGEWRMRRMIRREDRAQKKEHDTRW